MLPRVLLLCSATSWRLYLMVFELDWPFVLHWRSSSLLFEPLEAGVKVRKMPLKNVWFDLKCFCLLSSSCCCGWLVKRDRCPSHISPLDLWDFLFVKSFQNFSCIAPEMGGERSNVGHYLLYFQSGFKTSVCFHASMHGRMGRLHASLIFHHCMTSYLEATERIDLILCVAFVPCTIFLVPHPSNTVSRLHWFLRICLSVFLIVTQSKPTTGTSGLSVQPATSCGSLNQLLEPNSTSQCACRNKLGNRWWCRDVIVKPHLVIFILIVVASQINHCLVAVLSRCLKTSSFAETVKRVVRSRDTKSCKIVTSRS